MRTDADTEPTLADYREEMREMDAAILQGALQTLLVFEKRHGPVSPLRPGVTLAENARKAVSMRFFKRELITLGLYPVEGKP